MTKNKMLCFGLNLQLFAGEGAAASGEGDGGGAQTGEAATVDAEQRLRELGVPEDKLRRRTSRASHLKSTKTAKTQIQASDDVQAVSVPAESNTPEGEARADTPARMTWDEIMADPEYNKQMQATVQSRLKNAKAAEETLKKLTPALEVLARKHGLDPQNPDYEALAKAIDDDNAYYEDKALSMGVPVETAKKIDRRERDSARQKAQEERNYQENRIREHLSRLEGQGEAMKKVFPNFDLRRELQNPVFARMTSPGVGLSVEDAYYAVHRREIQVASMQATAQNTAKKISNAIASGSRRPDEAGIVGQAASITAFDPRSMSREERANLKRRIIEYKAQGRKLYPGQ